MSKTVLISSLVEDFDLYPRSRVNAQNLTAIRQARQAGVEMPPIVIDKASRRIVDGFHRKRVAEKLDGPEGRISVIEREYASEKEMIADAIRLNVARGLDLSPWDRVRAMDIAERHGLTLGEVAVLMQCQVEWLSRQRETRAARTSDDRRLSLKRSLRHMVDKRLTPDQELANERLSGMRPTFHVDQLLILLDASLLDVHDERLAERLAELVDKAADWLASREPPEVAEG
jgi:hypothetical protein